MPTNCGPLQIGTPSPSSQFRQSESEIADSLWWIFEIFPFLGDSGWRPGSICTAWLYLQSSFDGKSGIFVHALPRRWTKARPFVNTGKWPKRLHAEGNDGR